jgi:hypothetical protein
MKTTARGLDLAALAILFLCSLARASLSVALKHHASELLASYDFVIAGGGTCGLTVANRLSEAFPNSLNFFFFFHRHSYVLQRLTSPQKRSSSSSAAFSSRTRRASTIRPRRPLGL